MRMCVLRCVVCSMYVDEYNCESEIEAATAASTTFLLHSYVFVLSWAFSICWNFIFDSSRLLSASSSSYEIEIGVRIAYAERRCEGRMFNFDRMRHVIYEHKDYKTKSDMICCCTVHCVYTSATHTTENTDELPLYEHWTIIIIENSLSQSPIMFIDSLYM